MSNIYQMKFQEDRLEKIGLDDGWKFSELIKKISLHIEEY